MAWNRPEGMPKTGGDKNASRLGGFLRSKLLYFFVMMTIVGLVTYVYESLVSSYRQTIKPSADSAPTSIRKVESRGKNAKCATCSKFMATNELVATKKTVPPVIEKADVFFSTKRSRVILLPRSSEEIFDNEYEDFLYGVLTAIPGERFLEVELDGSFDEAYKVANQRPIVISPDDSDDVVEIKKAVIKAKETILEYARQGQNPRDVVLDARAELNKIADYRDQLIDNFNLLAATEKDPTVVMDYANEAEKILSEYGAMPLDAPKTREEMLEFMEAHHQLKEIQETERSAQEERDKI